GDQAWQPIYQVLNLPWIGEFSWDFVWTEVDQYLTLAGLSPRAIPITFERAIARQNALHEQREQEEKARLEAIQRMRAEAVAAQEQREKNQPRWGTPAAKQREIEKLRQKIEEQRKK
ncbi:MAG: hypothetical protein ACOY7J_07945, partial [Pseudomonadota bacterium]